MHRAVLALLMLSAGLSTARSDDDDTRFLLQRSEQAQQQRLEAQPLIPVPGTLVYEGQRYHVPDRLDALEPAIYIAINTQQWSQLPDFIERYQQLPGHRPGLALMASGLLARFLGDYAEASHDLERAQQLEPSDLRIRLELARAWFEDQQNGRARAAFASLSQTALPEQAQRLVTEYRQALDNRDQWHGSAAFGWGHNDNINQANGSRQCQVHLAGLDLCLFERVMPEPVSSSMLAYELAMERRIHLSGHHNVLLRPFTYGNQYSRDVDGPIRDYSYNLSRVQGGYQYLDARRSLSLAPYLEYSYRNHHDNYLAHGVQLEARQALGQRWQVGAALDARRYRYSGAGQRTDMNHELYQADLYATYQASSHSTLYGGLTLSRNRYPLDVASSQDWALRAGVYQSLGGPGDFYLNAMAIYRNSRSEAFDYFLGARRHDHQQVYMLTLGASAWQIAGLVPELRLRHSQTQSNLDWAYRHRQNEVALMLRKNF